MTSIYRQDFLMCPWCDRESGCRVDHLYNDQLPREFGPWYCKECRRGICGRVTAPGDVSVLRVSGTFQFVSRSMSLLRFDGVAGPVFFVMDHDRYHSAGVETDEDRQSNARYFFEEHSCPTNWLRECVAVIEDGDSDPHGFLTFVRAVDVPNDFDADNDNQWQRLFPEAFAADPMAI